MKSICISKFPPWIYGLNLSIELVDCKNEFHNTQAIHSNIIRAAKLEISPDLNISLNWYR